MDRRILPAAPGAMPGNASSPSHSGQPYSGHPSNEDDAQGTKSSGRSGTGSKRRTKKDGEPDAGEDEEGAKKKKSKRRKVDHACVYCRSVGSSFRCNRDAQGSFSWCRRSHMTCDSGRVSCLILVYGLVLNSVRSHANDGKMHPELSETNVNVEFE